MPRHHLLLSRYKYRFFWLEFRGPIYISVSSQPHGIYYKKYKESARA